jgi:hypothetical protein
MCSSLIANATKDLLVMMVRNAVLATQEHTRTFGGLGHASIVPQRLILTCLGRDHLPLAILVRIMLTLPTEAPRLETARAWQGTLAMRRMATRALRVLQDRTKRQVETVRACCVQTTLIRGQ